MTVTDKSGNSQTQTLSPAFRIDERLALDNLMDDGKVTVSIENSQLTVSDATGNAIVEIYDLAGRNVVTTKALSVNLGSFTGTYIVKVTDNDRIDTFKIAL